MGPEVLEAARAHLAEADLGDHALEAGTRDAAGSGAAEVVIDHLDLRPAELHEPLAHRVLQDLAFPVVLDLMGRGLADVEHCLARPMLRADLVSAHRHCSRAPAPCRWHA